MTRYVGCIDLHSGRVKQIVGSTLTEENSNPDTETSASPATNFVSEHPSKYYSELYRDNNVQGTHVIKLGPGNDEAAKEALKAWPGMLQVGGSINDGNAMEWLNAGASKVIITSWLFPNQHDLDWDRLTKISQLVGKERLVVDISCKVTKDCDWVVAINKWQDITSCKLNASLINKLSEHCEEILVHAADVEGLCQGIDEKLVSKLGEWCHGLEDKMTVVYAGGARSVADLDLVKSLSKGKVDLTYGSAVDIFGGNIKFDDLVAWNLSHAEN